MNKINNPHSFFIHPGSNSVPNKMFHAKISGALKPSDWLFECQYGL